MKLIVSLVLLVYPLLSAVVVNAHCGNKIHEGEGLVYVSQLSHDDLAFELKVAEIDPDVVALERAIEVQEEAEAQERLDQLIQDLVVHRRDRMESENFRVENGRFNSIPPAVIQLK